MGETLFCPYCFKDNLVKNGNRLTKMGRVQKYICNSCFRETSDPYTLDDMLDEQSKLQAKEQKFRDNARVARKSVRESSRLFNAVEELNKQTIDILTKHNFTKYTKYFVDKREGNGAILQLGDWHGNEEVHLKNNTYSFPVLAKRAQKLVYHSKKYFHLYGVKSVFLSITGDLINSDRRLDEIVSQSANRTKAMWCVVDILKSVILDLNQDFNVYIGSVCGNESRQAQEVGFSDALVTDNYDYSIYQALKRLFDGSKGVTFIDGDPKELVVDVNGKNILMLHGEEKILAGDVEKGILRLLGKYADQGIKIDFVLFGHLHYARIGEMFSRNSSMVGSNGYSDRNLHLISKASQNLHIVEKDGIHSTKIDLQNYNGFEGYPFNHDWIAYNSQADQVRDTTTIFKVVI